MLLIFLSRYIGLCMAASIVLYGLNLIAQTWSPPAAYYMPALVATGTITIGAGILGLLELFCRVIPDWIESRDF